MIWPKYQYNKPIRAKGESKEIIESLGRYLPIFFNKTRKERTRFIKVKLVQLGHKLNYKAYANNLSAEDKKKIGHKFVNREWLFDVHWYTESDHYSVNTLPLVVECEWDLMRRGDSHKIEYGAVKYDFQKLIIANAELKLMIFRVVNLETLDNLQLYFKNVINGYSHLPKGSAFLFIAFYDKEKVFYYKEIKK